MGASVPASAQTPTWSVVPSPNRGSGDTLAGMSCVSAAACTAVGSYINSSGVQRTLTESWNGTIWSVASSPSPGSSTSILDGVSCVSTAACTAVGYYVSSGPDRTLIESWNGTRWSVVPSPSPGASAGTYNLLYGVSCVSAAACTAVGSHEASSDDTTLIESWNGTRWSVVPSPDKGGPGLYGVSCVSAAACTAVGSYINSSGVGSTLVEFWNGTRWSVVPSPNPDVGNELFAVSCVSATACTAVGSYNSYIRSTPVTRTLIESWNGTSWTAVASPNRGGGDSNNLLYGVSCVSATACTTVGAYVSSSSNNRTLIESWNGTSWTAVASRNRGSADTLAGVSCVSAAACTAAGLYVNSSGGVRTLIEAGTASG